MPSDIKLDEAGDGWVTIEGSVLQAKTADLILDSPVRRHAGGGRFRRALVHNQDDGLTVNYNGDYPGGVNIINAQLTLQVESQTGAPKLPKTASVGTLKMLHNTTLLNGELMGGVYSLWVCVGYMPLLGDAPAEWREIPLGKSITGSE